MDGQLPQTPAPKSRGIPLWTALVALLLLVIAGGAILAGILYYTRSEKLKLERENEALRVQQEQAKVAEQKATEDAKLASARNRQEEVLNQTRSVTNVLQLLAAAAETVRTDAAALRTSEDGRRVALHPSLVRLARQLYEVNLPSLPAGPDIVSRLEAVRRLEQQLMQAAGTTYLPAPELTGEVQQTGAWAGDQSRKTDEIKTLLRTLVQESKIRVTTATLTAESPTLEAAINRLNEAELAAQQQVSATRTDEAKTTAADTVAQAEAERILAAAKAKAGDILAQAEAEAAAQRREMELRAATNRIEEARVRVATETAGDEARKIELRKTAADPNIQAKLAPFLTPGYWQITGTTLDKKPLSFTKLKNSGALEPSPKGGAVLATIVSTSTDKVRPRWKINPQLYTRYPDAIERINEAQKLLTELGPVLVELKMLEP